MFAPARNEGITTVAVLPTGGLVSGQGALVDIVEGGVSDMLVRAPIAMVAQVGDPQAANVSSRGELLVRLRELLEDTRAYGRRRADFERAETREFAASRIDLEAMLPVLAGRVPLLVVADKASDIEAALRLARDYSCGSSSAAAPRRGWSPTSSRRPRCRCWPARWNNIPGSFATFGARQENPGLLRRAGVDVALIGTGSDPDAFNVRNIKQEAGNAVAYGMTWDDALRAVTLTPAELFGVADASGRFSPGAWRTSSSGAAIRSSSPRARSTCSCGVCDRWRRRARMSSWSGTRRFRRSFRSPVAGLLASAGPASPRATSTSASCAASVALRLA